MHILFVGMFVFVRNFVLVWKLVKIAFSSKEKEKPIFMPDTLGFEYCGLERSDQKKKYRLPFFFSFCYTTGAYISFPSYWQKVQSSHQDLSVNVTCNPQEQEEPKNHKIPIFSPLFHHFDGHSHLLKHSSGCFVHPCHQLCDFGKLYILGAFVFESCRIRNKLFIRDNWKKTSSS